MVRLDYRILIEMIYEVMVIEIVYYMGDVFV